MEKVLMASVLQLPLHFWLLDFSWKIPEVTHGVQDARLSLVSMDLLLSLAAF